MVLCFTFSFGLILDRSFNDLDQKALQELDIEPSFLKDEELQQIYGRMLSKTKDYYIDKFEKADILIPQIKYILKQNNIPDVFLFMAMAESHFESQTKSWVGAKGIWQFMPSTGKIYGLKNDLYVDERLDIIKATTAAAKYLNRLHDMFGEWYLAAFAYNCGQGRVVEALTRAMLDLYVEQNPSQGNSKQIRYYRSIIAQYTQRRTGFAPVYQAYKEIKQWGIKPDLEYLLREQENLDRQYLPGETRRYLRKIISLAMMSNRNYLFANGKEHFLNHGINSVINVVKLDMDTSLRDVAKALSVDYETLKKLNTHIKQDIIPANKSSYNLYIPYEKVATFNQEKEKIKKVQFAFHTVQKGDTLIGISKHYNVPIALIREYNDLSAKYLRLKQKIVLPVDPYKVAQVSKTIPKSTSKKSKVHVVKQGDTLSAISRKYGVPYGEIKKRNNMKDNFLKLNQRLIIPEKV